MAWRAPELFRLYIERSGQLGDFLRVQAPLLGSPAINRLAGHANAIGGPFVGQLPPVHPFLDVEVGAALLANPCCHAGNYSLPMIGEMFPSR